MFLLCPQQLNQFTVQKTGSENISEITVRDLENKMQSMLNHSDLNPHDKVRCYNDLLQRYLGLLRMAENKDCEIVLKLPSEQKEKPDDGAVAEIGDLAQRDNSRQEIVLQVAQRAKKNVIS